MAGAAAFWVAASSAANAGPPADSAEEAEAALVEDGPTYQPLAVERSRDEDERIAERLDTIYGLVDELSGVEASSRAGVVHLEGTVRAEADREQAGQLAASLEGVAYVDNDVEVSSSVEDRVDPLAATFERRIRTFIKKLPIAALALAVFLPFVVIAKLLARWDRAFQFVTRTPLIGGIAQRIVVTAVVILGLVLALEVLDASRLVGAVLGTAGVVGVAFGFALRDIVENYLASVMLGLRRPFAIADHVVIDDLEGKVVRITTRETILMTLEGNHLRIPNSNVFKAVILNYTHNPLRRFDVPVGAGVDVDLAAAQRIGAEALAAMKGVLADPKPFSFIEELGDSTVTIRFFGWIDQRETDFFKARSEATRRVKVALDNAGIDMPEPTFRLRWIKKEGERPEDPTTVQPEVAELETGIDRTIDEQISRDLTRGENLLERK